MREKDYPPLPEPCGELEGVGFDYPVFDVDQMRAYIDADRAQRKPLTYQQVKTIHHNLCDTSGSDWLTVARAIEAAHGIKEQP